MPVYLQPPPPQRFFSVKESVCLFILFVLASSWPTVFFRINAFSAAKGSESSKAAAPGKLDLEGSSAAPALADETAPCLRKALAALYLADPSIEASHSMWGGCQREGATSSSSSSASSAPQEKWTSFRKALDRHTASRRSTTTAGGGSRKVDLGAESPWPSLEHGFLGANRNEVSTATICAPACVRARVSLNTALGHA